jgi:O-acetyl-ADP-ribose deacetylase (regulator of RNase III)
MRYVIEGDILEATYGVIVQQVNAQGVMGSGVARVIRDKYPVIWTDYSAKIKPKPNPTEQVSRLRLGIIIISEINKDFYIASIVAQQFFGKDSKRYTSYDALSDGLDGVADWNGGKKLPLHYPLIGAGLGGGKWPIISSIINTHFDKYEHFLWLQPNKCEPLWYNL